MDFLSLIWLVFLPIVFAIILILPIIPSHQVKVRRLAKWLAFSHFVYSLCFLLQFDASLYGLSFEKELTILNASWLKNLGISLKFAVDGMSLLLVISTIFFVLISLFMSKMHIRNKHKLYYSMVFLLEASILGIFCAKDMFMFFVFWELSLIPIYFLVSQWGADDARRYAMQFTILSFCANMFLFFGMLLIYYYNFAVSDVLTANIYALNMDDGLYPAWFRIMIFANFIIAFIVRIPLVPFHNWYPYIQMNAVAPVNILLAGLLMSSGVYGLIRFNLQVFPEEFKLFAPILMFWSLVNMIYGACLSIMQNDVKKMLAYAQISTIGFVLLGLSTLDKTGFDGAVFLLIAGSFTFIALYTVIASVVFRTKTSYIVSLGGLGQVMPKCLYLSLIICLNAIGIPFFMTFVPKVMIISGTIFSNLEQQLIVKIATVIAILIILISAGYFMYFFYKVFCSVLLEQWKKIKDLSPQEVGILSSLCLIMLYFGINPMSIIHIYQSVSGIILYVFQV